MNIYDEIKAGGDYCSGFKFPYSCPHDSVFQKDSKECQECYDDAMEGIKESINDNLQ